MRTLGRLAAGVAVVTAALAVVGMAAGPGKVTGRPKILGIVGVEILSTNIPATNLFYGRLVELNGVWTKSSARLFR